MELAIIKTDLVPTFVNKDLNKATKKIATIGGRIKKNFFEIALVMADVKARELYKEDGFKNAADYAAQVFGFKKTMTYSLIKIGQEYTNPELAESNLPHEEGHDFTVSQIDRMLPADRDRVVELVEEGTISPDMSCNEIKKVIQAEVKGDEDSDGDGTGTEGESEGKAPVEEIDEHDYAVQSLREAINRLYELEGNAPAVWDIINDIMREVEGE